MMDMDDIRQSLISSMLQAGQTPPSEIIPDGKIHRYSVVNGNGKAYGKTAWYVVYPTGAIPAGAFGDWRQNTSHKWRLSPSTNYLDNIQVERIMLQAIQDRDKKQAEDYATAAKRANDLYLSFQPASPDHPYLIKKHITPPPGTHQAKDRLVIPILSERYEIQSLQYIHPDGKKIFLPHGRTGGGFFVITGDDRALICEGVATGATLHEATGATVYVAFSSGNLLPVAQIVKRLSPSATITICGDNDLSRSSNVGADKAKAAADAIGAKLLLPTPSTGSDFNDMAVHDGLDAVKAAFDDKLPPVTIGSETKIPEHLLHPGGLIELMMTEIDQCSAAAVPWFSLGAVLSVLGSVMGQKVMTETGLRTNIYSMALGYSGTGKNGAISYLQNVLAASNAAGIVGQTELTSPTSILTTLQDSKVTILLIDEVGVVLSGLKNPSSPEAGIPRLMTKLFSSTDRPEIKRYADSKSKIYLPYHHLGFSGASTPEAFWESISSGQVNDGFLARLLIFESQDDAPVPRRKRSFAINRRVIDQINDIFSIRVENDKSSGTNPEHWRPDPYIIPKSAPAMELFHPWAMQYHKLKNDTKRNTSGIASIYARAAEHASKIALIHAISLHGADAHEVGTDSVRYACDLMDYLTKNTVRQVEANVCDTEISKYKIKIIKGIRAYSEKNKAKYGVCGATSRDIQRGPGQGLVSKNLKDILDSLVLAERIAFMSSTTKDGKQIGFYYVVD